MRLAMTERLRIWRGRKYIIDAARRKKAAGTARSGRAAQHRSGKDEKEGARGVPDGKRFLSDRYFTSTITIPPEQTRCSSWV